MARRIDGAAATPDLEMKLRLYDAAGRADAGDGLALAHLLAAPNEQHLVMGVSRYPAAGMADQQQIAEAA